MINKVQYSLTVTAHNISLLLAHHIHNPLIGLPEPACALWCLNFKGSVGTALWSVVPYSVAWSSPRWTGNLTLFTLHGAAARHTQLTVNRTALACMLSQRVLGYNVFSHVSGCRFSEADPGLAKDLMLWTRCGHQRTLQGRLEEAM